MGEIMEHMAGIIEQAAQSPLGLFALMVIALSTLGYFFFRTASEWTRIGMFVLMFIGVVSFGAATYRTTAIVDATTDSTPSGTDISGKWDAQVTYSWGDTYQEAFKFTASQNSFSGSASYLGHPRGVLEGTITGDRISFVIPLEELLGTEKRSYKNLYTGVITGNEIRFVMQDDRGNPPIEFLANRKTQ